MLRDKENNRLFRRVEIKVIFSDNSLPVKKLAYKAQGSRQAYGPEGIDAMLMNVADQLDQLYPWWEFKMIPLAPRGRVACYAFSVVGPRLIAELAATEGLIEKARQQGYTAALEAGAESSGE